MGDPKLHSKSKNVFLTSEGLKQLQSELDFLRKEKRKEIAKRLQEARDMAIEENAEYDAAMVEQDLVEGRITELEKILRRAKLISSVVKKSDIVTLGSTVIVQIGPSKIDQFTIVGKMEANPAKKRISNESPIGLALVGAKIGDSCEVLTPNNSYKVKIIEIK